MTEISQAFERRVECGGKNGLKKVYFCTFFYDTGPRFFLPYRSFVFNQYNNFHIYGLSFAIELWRASLNRTETQKQFSFVELEVEMI